jgi:hypothetical protein
LNSVAEYITRAVIEWAERDTVPDGLGATERDAAGQMVLHLCDPDCHGPSHEEFLTLTARTEESGRNG